MACLLLGQQPRMLLCTTPQGVRAGSACYAYFPHYRQHITRKGSALLRSRPGMRRPMLAPEQESAADQAASWVLTGQWKQDLAVQVPEVQQRVQAGVQGLCLVLAGAHQQAQCLWQYILSNWPAWKASLQDDAEVVLEYALALIPAWIGALYISTMRACQQVAAWELVQQAVDTGSAAAATAEAALTAATEGAQRAAEQLVQLIKQPRAPLMQSADAQQPDEDDHHQARQSSKLEAARVAYSIAWFGFGQPSGPAQTLAQHAQQLAQQMSLHDWQQFMQQQQQEPVQPRRWRKTQRREWVERVVHRARQTSSSSSPRTAQGLFRHPGEEGGWGAPMRAVTGALAAAQQGLQGCVQGCVQGCAEAVQSTSRAAVGGVQRAGTILVAPMRAAGQAVRRMEAPPAGVIAACVLVLAAAATSTIMRRRAEAAEQAVQQRRVMKQRAEELRAQKARIMGVLSVEVPSGSATGRRKGAAAPVKTSIPINMAGPGQGPDAWELEDAAAAEAAGSSSGVLRELDPEAAAMWKKFLAGSRAMDVPMWDNRMVDELPKVSRKEVDKQTQKIRSAAAPEERAAIEQADMEQLSRQLQQLDHAPIGRAARAAWLKEKRQQPQPPPQEERPPALPRTSSSPSADSATAWDADSSNPFAIPQEVRANWDTDMDEVKPRGIPAARRQPASRAPAQPSSGAGSRSSSRSGSRSSSSPAGAGAGSDNPFAIPRDVRVQWEAEDHMYSEPAKPILGNVIGGLLTKMTSGKAQSDAAQQHRQRRQQALRAEAVEAAAILRLQQQEEQQQHQQQSGRAAPQGLAGSGLQQQRQQPPGAVRGSVTAPAAEPAAASAAAAAGAEGLEEGSPEWEEHMRQDMLRSGAARRARLQQMRAQGPQGQARGGGAAGSSSSALSAVSAADAASVTAAIPATPKTAPAAGAAGVEQPTAGGAGTAAAGRQQKVDRSKSPFTV